MTIEHLEITRAKVHLQKENPFFSYLIMNLNIIKTDDVPSCAVDNKGNLYYNPKLVKEMDIEELKGVLAHEVMHLVLEHLERGENKSHEVYNIATDLVINCILKNNNFRLPNGLIPYNNSFDFKEDEKIIFTIDNLDKKNAEEVYNEIIKQFKKHQKNEPKLKKVCENGRFDEHKYGKKSKNGNGKDEKKEKAELQKKWKKVFSEASVYAKQQGKLPVGIDRLIDVVLNEKVSWKTLLYKYITNELPFDYTYNKPSRRSRATGIYMPSILKENIEIVVAIDTSGSIQQKELSEFLGEIINISKSFNNITMKVIVCDCEIKDVYDVKNGSIQTILDLKIRGGGGTSHKPVYDYVRTNLPNTKFIINFTDGYSSFPKYEEIKTIWILTKDSCKDEYLPFGDIIRLN